ncbi:MULTISPECIES: ABC transporter ATP-binding protein [Halanaerobium]|jgi:oligopeptide/dipeptide ABC transporter ATP-binding protein|uniref:Peptide/nickel transport system ATP-binding protein n=1 Tax=Halanaerobium kushneri TaxID=56779 RepID=A0A1N6R688_9FIRM|nr:MULTISPECIES: ABC transporter ATP-binding protein [Halanaerobium]RCW61837.1 peptide/nickel transport system ATP-binding protein [Halanaerobium sp. ST460_2HS_T2]SIQ24343.1 peptide/nickel transport system ATP-binding protein [Halanaerobium kushneri]
MSSSNCVIDVKNLQTFFNTENGVVKAVNGVSFSIEKGKTLGIVGESGCGKSMTSMSLMNLVPRPKGFIAGGEINYFYEDGSKIDITEYDHDSEKMRKIRGNEMAMIFQEPMTSLNPVYTVGDQIIEAIKLHQNYKNKDELRERAVKMLKKVGISAPENRVDEYPHEFSGGMRQRAMIAMALSCNPRLLIADEPTTALDVTVEAQIINLMGELQKDMDMSIMFITHDLGVIGDIADEVMVMYTGKVVEKSDTKSLFSNPKHPYTRGLLNSRPVIGSKKRLEPIEGSVPDLLHLPEGCDFYDRCPKAMEICKNEDPPVFEVEDCKVKCWLYREEEKAS